MHSTVCPVQDDLAGMLACCADAVSSETIVVLSAVVALVVGNWTLFQAMLALTKLIHDAQTAAIGSLTGPSEPRLLEFYLERERNLRLGLVGVLIGTGVLMLGIGVVVGLLLSQTITNCLLIGVVILGGFGIAGLGSIGVALFTHLHGQKERSTIVEISRRTGSAGS